MGENIKSAPVKENLRSRREAWKERPEAGAISIKAVLGIAAVALVITPVAGAAYKAYDEARRANHMEEYPNGMLPRVEDSDSKTPFIELDSKGNVHVDLERFFHSIKVERFDASYDVEVGSAIIHHNADTVAHYTVASTATAGLLGKQLTVPLPAFNYDARKEFRSTQRQQFFVPAEAVEGVRINDNTRVFVDVSKLESHTTYTEAPTLTPFTLKKDGSKDFSNPTSVTNAYINGVAAVGAGSNSLIDRFNDFMPGDFDITALDGFSGLQIELNRMESDSQKYIFDSMNTITNNACKNSFDEELVEAIKTGYRDAAVKQFGVDPNKLTIEIKNSVNITNHYEGVTPSSDTAAPATQSSDQKAGVLQATSTVTNMPQEALKAQVGCDDSSFAIAKGGSNG